MNELLKKALTSGGKGCVTITMNTHRTQPGNQADPIALKNLVKKAVEMVGGQFGKGLAERIAGNLLRTVSGLDLREGNLDSIVIFADSESGAYTRLPVSVTDRVVVGDTFAVRDLVRAVMEEFPYYILVLSRNEAKLIEAFDDRLVSEKGDNFPLTNPLYTSDPVKLTNRHGQDNFVTEFFNNVDKALWNTIKDDIKPVILATERRNYDYYMEVADRPELIIGYVTRNGEGQPSRQIVANAWHEAREILERNNLLRLGEIDDAIDRGVLITGYSEIWNALAEGRGEILFVRKGFHMPARIAGNPEGGWSVMPADATDVNGTGVLPDAIDDMVSMVLDGKGEVVFTDGDRLDQWGGAALIARYALPE